jgi:hypothetical protein
VLPVHLAQVQAVCEQALAVSIGLRLRLSSFDTFRNRFYQLRKLIPEAEKLDLLTAVDGTVLLIRKDAR